MPKLHHLTFPYVLLLLSTPSSNLSISFANNCNKYNVKQQYMYTQFFHCFQTLIIICIISVIHTIPFSHCSILTFHAILLFNSIYFVCLCVQRSFMKLYVYMYISLIHTSGNDKMSDHFVYKMFHELKFIIEALYSICYIIIHIFVYFSSVIHFSSSQYMHASQWWCNFLTVQIGIYKCIYIVQLYALYDLSFKRYSSEKRQYFPK